MNRAYSLLEVKSLDSESRELTGIATTPTPDRVGDIVVPTGATFADEVPLLWQHNKTQPVGIVKFGKPTKDGISFSAKIPLIYEEGALKTLVDLAWQSVKAKLVRGVSIGFVPKKYNYMADGGVEFSEIEIYELSLVTIPANAEATISTIKSFDTAERAALGMSSEPSSAMEKPTRKSGISYSKSKVKTMNIKEQIIALEAKRKELTEERTAIQTKAVDEGRTKDSAEAERFAEISAEVTAIDKELGDLREMEKDIISTAEPVAASPAAVAKSAIVVQDNRIRKEGLALAQFAKCLYLAQGNLFGAHQLADANKSLDPRVPMLLKAAVAAGTTSNAAWAGNLVGAETSVYADFIEFLRPQTILGKFGAGGVPALRNVPFRTPLVGQTSGGAGYWVGENKPKPLTKFDFSRTVLDPLKVANIAVLSEEVVRDSSPSADLLVRDGLVAALRERLDIDFIDPTKTASAGESPASITNGLTPIPSSGSDAAAIRADIKGLFSAFIAANNAPTAGVFIMSSTTALALSLMTNPLGQPEFPGISMLGGTLSGLPVIVSEYVPTDSSGSLVILANASDIYIGDDGGFQVDLSREASLQMNDSPDSPATASTVLVSLWQHNLVGFRAERVINWKKRRASAVAYLSGVTWGAGA